MADLSPPETEEGPHVISDWESAAESGELDARLLAHFEKTSKATSDDMSSKSAYSGGSTLPEENSNRTQYQPTIKILKRPTPGKSDTQVNSDSNTDSNRPYKTLEQRQLEYAQARMRILGSADDGGEAATEISQLKNAASNGDIGLQVATNPRTTNNMQLATNPRTANNMQLATNPRTANNMQLATNPRTANNMQLATNPRTANNMQVATNPRTANNMQLASNPRAPNNMQLATNPRTANNMQLATNPRTANHMQPANNPRTANNIQLPSNPRAPNNMQLASNPRIANNMHLPTNPRNSNGGGR